MRGDFDISGYVMAGRETVVSIRTSWFCKAGEVVCSQGNVPLLGDSPNFSGFTLCLGCTLGP